MNLNKNDFYYGALLSRPINSGFARAIVGKDLEDAKLYTIYNNLGDYTFYTKYISKPDGDRNNEKRWDFLFNSSEINYIKNREDEQPIIALICGDKNLKGSRIALIDYPDYQDCIGRDYRTLNRYVKVKHRKGSKHFKLYGTGLDGSRDNNIKITGNVSRRLKELEELSI